MPDLLEVPDLLHGAAYELGAWHAFREANEDGHFQGAKDLPAPWRFGGGVAKDLL